MLDLNACIHFHEEVVGPFDDAFKGRNVVEAHTFREARAIEFHSRQRLALLQQILSMGGVLGLLGGARQKLVGQRELELLLLVHLDGAIASTERDRPIAVADDLDLVVPGRFEIELDQEIPVGTRLEDLLFRQDIHDCGGSFRRAGYDALALAATATDTFVADAFARILLPDRMRLALSGFLQLFDRDEFDRFGIASLQELFGVVDELDLRIPFELEVELLGELLEGLLVANAFGERERRDVVDSGNDCISEGSCELLGFVLRAGAANHRGRGPDETDARGFDGFDEIRIFGHESIAGEDMRVSVLFSDLDDFADAFEFFFLSRTHVVCDAMDVAGKIEITQFGGETPWIDDRVFLRKQHAVLANADFAEDVEGFFADRTAAHHETFDVADSETACPFRVAIDRLDLFTVAVQHGSIRAPAAVRPLAPLRISASRSRGCERERDGSRPA